MYWLTAFRKRRLTSSRDVLLELAPKGIRVNAVNPGVVVTNLHKRAGMDENEYEVFS